MAHAHPNVFMLELQERSMKAIAIIPARFASTRFPGKPLANDTGKYLIQHVYERVQQAQRVHRVIVATDDHRIAQAVQSFGGCAEMTRDDHPSGTDRIAEVAARLDDCDLVLNVQGDEPEIDPHHIDRLVDLLSSDSKVSVGTLACPFAVLKKGDPTDPHAVKVVLDARSYAIYFSRALIPYPQRHATDGALCQPAPYLLHIGVYAYRRDFLLHLATLQPTPLEQTERLEQLRWLEHGYKIAVAVVDGTAVGVDTPEDYAEFVRRHREAT